ncbi:hypothetical protein UPYG_G00071550 [Umbra pygmaea]|uniref:Meiotic recombination protein REC8 homolog n=1 Tax=Umbra pygmaea TaxID=75934 RepID=A0ABD0XBQ0_UMBPY
MFYYPNVLQRHTGCFSTIWLAATKGIRITRRELLRVNVGQTCEDIMKYVTVQVAPPCPGLPRPRFSLYLSSQLQYGVVIIYHRQCGFLLEEIQQSIERLVRSERYTRIDLADPDKHALNNPDPLLLLQETDGAPDPFFGVMSFENQLPSPYHLFQLMESMIPDRPLVTSPRTAPQAEGFRSPADAITLTEQQQTGFAVPEFVGAELPEATCQEIDMLLEQKDQFHHEMEDREWDRDGERSRDMEPGLTSIDQLKVSAVGGDSVWLLDEETVRPMEVQLEVVAVEITPPPPVAMPAPTDASEGKEGSGSQSERESQKDPGKPCTEVVDIDAPPKIRSRRRQLIFSDPHVQISQDAMLVQLEDPLTETVPLSQVLINLKAQIISPAELYSAPSGSLLHPDLLSLWKQCFSLATLPLRERETEEGSSELDREVERKEGGREGEKQSTGSRMREMPRESLGPGGAAPSETSVEALPDVSKEERSLDQITPVSIGSLVEEPPFPMEAILEENVDLPEREAEAREITAEALLSVVLSYLQRFGKVTFHSLLPPEAARTAAVHMFSRLLELVSARKLSVCQTEPYSLITIIPGKLRSAHI